MKVSIMTPLLLLLGLPESVSLVFIALKFLFVELYPNPVRKQANNLVLLSNSYLSFVVYSYTRAGVGGSIGANKSLPENSQHLGHCSIQIPTHY